MWLGVEMKQRLEQFKKKDYCTWRGDILRSHYFYRNEPMEKLFLMLVICTAGMFVSPQQLMAQRSYGADYTTSVGVRLSPFYGPSIKHFFRKTEAVEGILHTSWGAIKITGLYEKHLPALGEPGLRFFFGGDYGQKKKL